MTNISEICVCLFIFNSYYSFKKIKWAKGQNASSKIRKGFVFFFFNVEDLSMCYGGANRPLCLGLSVRGFVQLFVVF